jgi:hypothetical protein
MPVAGNQPGNSPPWFSVFFLPALSFAIHDDSSLVLFDEK